MSMVLSSLAGLLLLLAACSNAIVVELAKPVEYEYHSFAVSPLSPHTYTAPGAADAKEDAAVSSSALHVRLVHRDSFTVNASAADLLARCLQRDERRAAWIIMKAAMPADPENGTVVTGAPTSGEYIAKITVGTPHGTGVEVLLAPDMGSDLMWLQCMPCFRCYHQPGPVYARRSRSWSHVGCDAPACHALGSFGGCTQFLDSCQYKVGYGDGSSTAGDLGTETLTFAGAVRVPDVPFGCGSDNQGLFPAPAEGILGLGRGNLSFPSQIAGRYGRSFSYCLAGLAPRSSTLTFSSGATTTTTPPASFTPMLSNPRMYTFYYVRLVGISVGGVPVPGVTESDLRLDPSTGHGGIIVDSGTAVTRLAGPAFTAFRDAFRAAAVRALGWPSPGGPFGFFDTCYSVRGRVKVPPVSMHFAGGVEVKLPPQNYLIPVDSKGTMCLAFAGSGDRGVSIIGNIQLQGFHVVYDVDGQRVGFVPNSC